MSPIASVSKSNIALKDTALTSLINLKPELSIPAYARANSYSAELVWNLSTLPQQ
ncbi:hypothetical protein [Holzapfeliella floricola]|uniref:hypothetical protein n=1 Tax=Holzapfeliella floricola TaxID=679249 RepID=UPI000A937D30|nr:hypothetical protein [Holzapfeliella floricola]